MYTENHEWLRKEGKTGTVGISDFAQSEIGQITFVELPSVGMFIEQGEYVCVIETVKTSMEVCAPVSGEITEVNNMLDEVPEMINEDPLGDGWVFKIKGISREQADELMTLEDYDEFVQDIGSISEDSDLTSPVERNNHEDGEDDYDY